MRRVSSRQRLVSWDAFDATRRSNTHRDEEISSSDSDSADEHTDNHVSPSQTQNVITSADHASGAVSSPVSPTDLLVHRSEHSHKNDDDGGGGGCCTSVLHLLKHPSLRRDQRRSGKRSRALKSKSTASKGISNSNSKAKSPESPTFVPAFSWELSQAPPLVIPAPPLTLAQPSLLDALNDDVQLHVFTFLDLESLRKMLSVNKKLRQFVLHPDNKAFLWDALCSSKSWWSEFMHTNAKRLRQSSNDDHAPGSQGSTQINLQDNVHVPIAAMKRSKRHKDHQEIINLPLYCSWIPQRVPTSVHKIFERGCQRWRSMFSLKASVDNNTGREWIQYTGVVGTGDRCVRGNHPLPRPIARGHKHHSFLERFCRNNRAVITEPLSEWRPFCAPHRIDDNTLDLSPRLVSYYEVTIQAHQDQPAGENDVDDDGSVRPLLGRRHTRSDCVAVGLATESFPLYSRMPGWDRMSYGYHGDDGGIFHSAGGMIEKFGPSFGPGDTVGCGLDYVSQSIFYTLNGEFLGHAWRQLDWDFLQNKLYPVVGIDTNSPISINFGQSKFEFDLSAYIEPHNALIREAYSLTGKDALRPHHSRKHHRFSPGAASPKKAVGGGEHHNEQRRASTRLTSVTTHHGFNAFPIVRSPVAENRRW